MEDLLEKSGPARDQNTIELLSQFFENLDTSLFLYDLQSHHHIWTSENFAKIIGYRSEEINAMTRDQIWSLYHPDDQMAIAHRVDILKKNPERPYSGFYRMKHKYGHWIWVFCRARILYKKATGLPWLMFGLLIDFSHGTHTEKQMEELIRKHRRMKNQQYIDVLTRREEEVIQLIAQGLTCYEIAQKLRISHYTVETHRKNIFKKLNVSKTAELVSFSIKNGLQ